MNDKSRKDQAAEAAAQVQQGCFAEHGCRLFETILGGLRCPHNVHHTSTGYACFFSELPPGSCQGPLIAINATLQSYPQHSDTAIFCECQSVSMGNDECTAFISSLRYANMPLVFAKVLLIFLADQFSGLETWGNEEVNGQQTASSDNSLIS